MGCVTALSAAAFGADISAQEKRWEQLNEEAASHFAARRLPEAVGTAEQALELAEQTFGPRHRNTLNSIGTLAGFYTLQGRLAEAEAMHQRAITTWGQMGEEARPELARALSLLIAVYERQGRLAEAEATAKRALAVLEQSPGSEFIQARLLEQRATLCERQQKFEEAESLLNRSLEIREAVLGPSDPEVGNVVEHLAELHVSQGHDAESEPLYARLIAICELLLGGQTISTKYESVLSQAVGGPEHPQMTEPAQRIMEKRAGMLGFNEPRYLSVLDKYAGVLRRLGRTSAAEGVEMKAAAIRGTAAVNQ